MSEFGRMNRTTPAPDTASRIAVVRMAFVIASSLAVLIAMPGWIRGLEMAHELTASGVAADSAAAEVTHSSDRVPAHAVIENPSHLALADSLGKRYRVSKEALGRFVRLAYTAGQMTKVDPLLILAVMAVESSFNPIAESVVGAKGLMQIIPEYHQDKLVGPDGATVNVLDPEANILAGAKVLREYATRTGEDIVAALRLYGGIGPDPANSYPAKVLSERERLQQILRSTPNRRDVHSGAPAPRS